MEERGQRWGLLCRSRDRRGGRRDSPGRWTVLTGRHLTREPPTGEPLSHETLTREPLAASLAPGPSSRGPRRPPGHRELLVQLTGGRNSARQPRASWRLSRTWTTVTIGCGLAAVFVIDRATGTVPFQHLYYLPIILAAQQFGSPGGWLSSLAAIGLYHLANPALLALAHKESDVVQIVLFLVVGVVTARLREHGRRLEALAGTDDLTELHNLRGFEQRLRGAVRQSREARTPLSMLVVDVDHLKALNDEHGHLTGAEAVREIGRIIASHLPPAAFACRYGGDEFAVALPRLTASAAGGTAAAILRSVHAAAPTLAGTAFPPGTLSVSIGLACAKGGATDGPDRNAHDDGRAGEALFRLADAALYEAKRLGRNRVWPT
jgi:diguanylate cyclase (GGDEF)-like protein